MNRFLQKLLIFSTFLLLLSGWQRFNVGTPAKEAFAGKPPVFEQASVHAFPGVLTAPLQLLPFSPQQQHKGFTAAKPAGSLHRERSLTHSLHSIPFSAFGEETPSRPLYLLFRKLRT